MNGNDSGLDRGGRRRPRPRVREELRWSVAHRRRVLTLYGVVVARRRRFVGLLDGRVVINSRSATVAGAGLIRLSTLMPTEPSNDA